MTFLEYIKNRKKSFAAAFSGLFFFFRTEYSAWIHACAIITSVGLGLFFKIDRYEWFAIVLAIGLALVAEILNTAIELIADFVHPDHHEKIGRIKDVAAAAVLFSAITSFVIGCLVFVPYFMGK